jgi:hypothetical protein
MAGGGNDGFEGGAVNPILSVHVLLKFGDVFVTSTCYTFTICGTHVMTAVRWYKQILVDAELKTENRGQE